ncbi:AI-2E family transporter [Bacteroides sp. 51]|uniref:AI-2E family transporter n=1 Tax=Bacteroides sp. 51 TaxID=2302938 RepID=UPI0013D78F46|nr:AI-2E family transporter [Bacteroides sp. 51]NDV81509.1 AI-2E family transporter [Bacteroides sp. 51]
MNFKEQYKKYSLIAIILILGLAIFLEAIPFMSGVLGAMTIYILLRGQMKYLTEKKKMKKGLAATILLGESILVFLIPLTVVAIIIVDKFSTLNLNPQELIDPIQNISNFIQEKTGYNLLKTENLSTMLGLIPRIGQYLMNGVSSFMINIFVLIFILYFMLVGRERMETYIYDILPFSEENKKEVLHDINMIVTSNAIGIPLLGIIQGGIALVGYYIFGVPAPLIFGLLTGIATVIPVVGTGLVWLPLAVYLAIIGDWPNAIGLLCYGLLVVSQVDNLIRLILQKKMADIHPLITIFGVVIGLSLFGFMGIIFGPLLLSMFILCFNIFKKEYLK